MRAILIAVLALGLSQKGGQAKETASPEKDLTGVYDADGGSYRGKTTIRKSGEAYQFLWDLGSSTYYGVGLREGDALSVSFFARAGAPGVIVYKIQPGKLVGRYSVYPGTGKVAAETLTFKAPLQPLPAPRAWAVGDAALVAWSRDQFWYPAAVTKVENGRYMVQFMDGSSEWADAAHMIPEDIRVGDRVMGRYQQGMEYYPGKITERKAQTVHIQYDDGDQETTLLSAVRVLRPREP